MNKLSAFLHLYLYQIETTINLNPSELSSVEFHSEEANTDESLKIFFKSFISIHREITPEYSYNVEISNNDSSNIFSIDDLKEFYITDVLLPFELSIEHKNIIQQQKQAIYTKPDLFLSITNRKTSQIYHISIELKSTKNNKIPGSSIQQISPYEWVIFVRHNNNSISVTTGVYINSITDRLAFPDRSPRPEIGFNTLSSWNRNYRVIHNNTLQYNYRDSNITAKLAILDDWHSFLVKEWINTVKQTESNREEKWFNHTLRLYSIELLTYYDSLPKAEQELFKKSIYSIIEKSKHR